MKYDAVTEKGKRQIIRRIQLGWILAGIQLIFKMVVVAIVVTGALFLFQGLNDPRPFVVYMAILAGCQMLSTKLTREVISAEDLDFTKDFKPSDTLKE
jgi:hypothetical protein